MAARHLDEGLLGWLLMTAALVSGTGLCVLAGYFGARVGRRAVEFVDNVRPDF